MYTFLQEKFRPQRNYRRVGAPPKDLQAQVESTLFEFGHFPSITVSKKCIFLVESKLPQS